MNENTKQRQQLRKVYTADDARIKGKGRWEKLPMFWFLLFLSYQCTRRCKYCYAFNQVGDRAGLPMDESTFSRLLDWIPEVWRQNNVRVNIINFLGGEPLLWTDRIKKVMDRVFRATDGMQGLVNTNADLVDRVNWDDLEYIQWISVNITDLSIDDLSKRMGIIAERSNVINQTITATLDDHNLKRITEISRFGIENGYRLRFNKDIFRGKDPGYQELLLKKYHELCDLFEHYVLRGVEVHTTFLLDTLIPLWDLDTSPYPCGKRLATVFPDGSIGPCIRDHNFRTGTLFDQDPLSKLRCDTFHFDVAKPDVPDECRRCDSRTACQGGCPHDKLLMTGSRSGKSVTCHIHREIIPRLRALEGLKAGANEETTIHPHHTGKAIL